MSTSQLTMWAAIVAGAAVILLVLLDRRKPARRRDGAPRTPRFGGEAPQEATVTVLPATLYRRPPIYKRLADVVGLGVIAVVFGAVTAVLLAFTVFALLTLVHAATG